MVLRPRSNPPRSAGYSDPDELGVSTHGTPAPSDAGPLDGPVPDAPVPVPAPAKYTEGDPQRMTKLCMDSFLQALSNHPELHPGQLDLHRNASSSLAPIWSLGFLLDLHTRFPLTLHTRPLTVCATELAGHLCMSRKDIPLWYLSADRPLVKA